MASQVVKPAEDVKVNYTKLNIWNEFSPMFVSDIQKKRKKYI